MSDGAGQALIHCGFLVGVFPLAAPWWLRVTFLFVIWYSLSVNGGCSDVFLDTQFDLVKLSTLDLTAQQLYANMYGEAMPRSCKEATNPDTAFLSPELASRLTASLILFLMHTRWLLSD